MTPLDYFRKAERALASAQLLLGARDTEGACNRAYYAMFDAAQAALLASGRTLEGGTSKTHRGLIAAFGRELVQAGHVDAALGRTLNRVHDIRLVADYTAEPPTHDDAAWAVAQADAFVAELRANILGRRL